MSGVVARPMYEILSDELIAHTLNRYKLRVSSKWLELLEDEGNHASVARQHVLDEMRSGRDLFSVMIGNLYRNDHSTSKVRHFIINKVHLPDYSITDFFTEVCTLEQAISDTACREEELTNPESAAINDRVKGWLRSSFHTVLRETAVFYEYVAETGARGLCQLNMNGEIAYANEKLKTLLGAEDVLGSRLEPFFSGADADFVQNAVTSGVTEGRELRLARTDGSTIGLSAEIHPLIVDGEWVGSYASFTDITAVMERERRLFERSPLGIIQIDKESRITYANSIAKRLLHDDECEGLLANEVIPNEEDRKIFQRAVQLRQQKKGSEYHVNIAPLRGVKEEIPASVVGIPITDINDNWIGSIGIIRNLLVEQVTAQIHSCIETIHDYREMLESVAQQTLRVIDADMVIISRYSADLGHGWPFFSYFPDGKIVFEKRWYPLSQDMVRWISQPQIEAVGDFEAFMDQSEWRVLKTDRAVRDLLFREQMRSFLKIPLFTEGRLVATVSVFSRTPNAYQREHVETAKALPLREAVISALNSIERDELQFRFSLAKEIATLDSIKAVAQMLVNRLGEHYEWWHSSIFRVDQRSKSFKLLAQYSLMEDCRLPANYEQPLTEGVLAEVLRKAQGGDNSGVVIGNIQGNHRYASAHIAMLDDMKSELCLPIVWDGDVRWLLNVEDRRQSVFTKDERDRLAAILSEVGWLLDQMAWLYRLNSGFELTSDGIVVTNTENQIIRANPAFLDLLGYKDTSNLPRELETLFSDKYEGQSIMRLESMNRQQSAMRHRNGSQVDILLTKFGLHGELLGKVYVVQDLAAIKRVEEFKLLGDMFYDIAIQTQTPISLMSMWLQRLLSQELPVADYRALTTKSLEQLCKVQGTFDRLALYHEGRSLLPTERIDLDVLTELNRVVHDLPKTDRDGINLSQTSCPTAVIHADPYQISFVFQTIISYLLRFRPVDRNVSIKTYVNNDWVDIEFSGLVPEQRRAKTGMHTFVSRAQAEVALGERIIRTFVEEKHHGKYSISGGGGLKQFHVKFPVVA